MSDLNYKIVILALITIVSSNLITALVLNKKGDLQKKICHIQDKSEATRQCKNGDVMLYQPTSYNKEHSPIIISAILCDYKHQVVYNVDDVSCIFSDSRQHEWNK